MILFTCISGISVFFATRQYYYICYEIVGNECVFRFTHIVLDRVKVGVGSLGSMFITVLYLATLEGAIHKMVVFPRGNAANDDVTDNTLVCLVEVLNLSERPRSGFLRSLQLHNDKVSLGFSSEVHLICYSPVLVLCDDAVVT